MGSSNGWKSGDKINKQIINLMLVIVHQHCLYNNYSLETLISAMLGHCMMFQYCT